MSDSPHEFETDVQAVQEDDGETMMLTDPDELTAFIRADADALVDVTSHR